MSLNFNCSFRNCRLFCPMQPSLARISPVAFFFWGHIIRITHGLCVPNIGRIPFAG